MSPGHGHGNLDAFYTDMRVAKTYTDSSAVDTMAAAVAMADTVRNDDGLVEYNKLTDEETQKTAFAAAQKALVLRAMSDTGADDPGENKFKTDQLLKGKYGIGVGKVEDIRAQYGEKTTADIVYREISRDEGFQTRQNEYNAIADSNLKPSDAGAVKDHVSNNDVDWDKVGTNPRSLGALLRLHEEGELTTDNLRRYRWLKDASH